MFVQKKYPEVKYTLHIELTEEEARMFMREMYLIYEYLRYAPFFRKEDSYPTLYRLLSAIKQEADLPFGC